MGRRRGRGLTERHQDFVQHVVKGPDVGGPVGMTEAPLKGEETGQDLRELTLKHTPSTVLHVCVGVCLFVCVCVSHHDDKWPEGQSADRDDDAAESQKAEQTETPPADRTVCSEANIFITTSIITFYY